MGYESKIYIVSKSKHSYPSENGRVWGEVIAKIEMCKCYPLSEILRNSPKTNCYIFADDGETEIVEDCYGEPLTETTIDYAIKAVKQVIAKGHGDYWRYWVLLSTLQSIQNVIGIGRDDFVVLHYGH